MTRGIWTRAGLCLLDAFLGWVILRTGKAYLLPFAALSFTMAIVHWRALGRLVGR